MRRSTVWVMAAGAGLGVAKLYYGVSLYPSMAASVGAPGERMGLVNALFQGGCVLGMLLFLPLGDILGKRGLVVAMLLADAAALLALAAAPGFVAPSAAVLAVGGTTVVPQILVPFAAGLAAPEGRGRVVSLVIGSLLLGILLSPMAMGLVGGWLGSWRVVYMVAAALMASLAAVLRGPLPQGEPAGRGLSYFALMRSLMRLLRDEPVLRQSRLFRSLVSGAFSAFWATLALFLAGTSYSYGPERSGLFGVAGAAGALAAPLVGRAADRRGPRRTIGLGLCVTLVSLLVFLLGGGFLAALLAGVVLLDRGVQGSHISNQSRIYSLPANAHSRLNTVCIFTFFLGGAAGSALGATGWQRWGWPGLRHGAGVCGRGTAAYFTTGGWLERVAGASIALLDLPLQDLQGLQQLGVLGLFQTVGGHPLLRLRHQRGAGLRQNHFHVRGDAVVPDLPPIRRLPRLDRKENGRIVAEPELLKDRPGAERACPDQFGTAVVLQGTGEDLRRAGRPLVDQDDERQISGLAAGLDLHLLAPSAGVLFDEHDLTFLEKLARHRDRLFLQSSGVGPDVKDYAPGPSPAHLLQGRAKLDVGLLAELSEGYVRESFTREHAPGHARNLDLGPGHGEFERFRGPLANQLELDLAPRRTTHLRNDPVEGQSFRRFAVHRLDGVPRLDPRLAGGRVWERVGDSRPAVLHRDCGPDSIHVPFQTALHTLHLFLRQEGGMADVPQ